MDENEELASAPMYATGRKLKALREQTGLTIRAVANLLGYGDKHTSYGYYESAYKKPYLPIDLVQKLDPIFTQRGVSRRDLWQLAGVEPPLMLNDNGKEDIKTTQPRKSVRQRSVAMLTIPELDMKAGGASGGDVRSFSKEGGLSNIERRADWAVPQDWADTVVSPEGRELYMFVVVGNSMAPDFPAGTRVMVNGADRTPSPPGAFLVHDGMSYVIKFVNYVPFSEPPAVRLASRDSIYPTYECRLEDAYIQGRVVGHWAYD